MSYVIAVPMLLLVLAWIIAETLVLPRIKLRTARKAWEKLIQDADQQMYEFRNDHSELSLRLANIHSLGAPDTLYEPISNQLSRVMSYTAQATSKLLALRARVTSPNGEPLGPEGYGHYSREYDELAWREFHTIRNLLSDASRKLEQAEYFVTRGGGILGEAASRYVAIQSKFIVDPLATTLPPEYVRLLLQDVLSALECARTKRIAGDFRGALCEAQHCMTHLDTLEKGYEQYGKLVQNCKGALYEAQQAVIIAASLVAQHAFAVPTQFFSRLAGLQQHVVNLKDEKLPLTTRIEAAQTVTSAARELIKELRQIESDERAKDAATREPVPA